MKSVQHILCPVDFSESSNEALHYALQLSIIYKASLHLLHVLPQINYYDWNTMSMYALISDETFKKESEAMQSKLDELLQKCQSEHADLSISASLDDTRSPADAILQYATEHKNDLIVMGSHGRKGLDRLLMGSVAESVLRHAHCEVMIIKKSFKPE